MVNQPTKGIFKIIMASSLGTMIEWYDFYIFGSLAGIISTQFFPKENPTAAFLATLAAFGVGFVIRPFGAIIFGRLGDIVGRKYTFLITLLIMGGSTFAIGLIPGIIGECRFYNIHPIEILRNASKRITVRKK